ncbi:helix-turn-helix domain-containing protein [Caldalkalibacillus mannanilyticus]|uniref:helix-turn-helix domain-containing protein n=1 Tax=Caldalkalibacillus mannanilyticus TaxID=1418 RepID=UPI00046AED34|nr:helix-turn-helix transcriptional regulator [Caldalkalibacillus mannanilyticus]
MEEQVLRWGKRIRAFRKLKGFTQEELARDLHVSVSVIGSIERGKKVPTTKLFEDIAQHLGVTIEELKAEGSGS